MATRKYPPVEIVRQSLRYEDGRLFWLERPRSHFASVGSWHSFNSKHSGKEAGRSHLSRGGYFKWIVRCSGIEIGRSGIVWALHHGAWPVCELDHKDRDSLNDRIENLRLATRTQNNANKAKSIANTSGFKGVSWHSEKRRWVASIRIDGRATHLGYFDRPEDAHVAYAEAVRRVHGEFACDGGH